MPKGGSFVSSNVLCAREHPSAPAYFRVMQRPPERPLGAYVGLWQALETAMQLLPQAFPFLQLGWWPAIAAMGAAGEDFAGEDLAAIGAGAVFAMGAGAVAAAGHLMNLPAAFLQDLALAAEPKARAATAAKIRTRMVVLPNGPSPSPT